MKDDVVIESLATMKLLSMLKDGWKAIALSMFCSVVLAYILYSKSDIESYVNEVTINTVEPRALVPVSNVINYYSPLFMEADDSKLSYTTDDSFLKYKKRDYVFEYFISEFNDVNNQNEFYKINGIDLNEISFITEKISSHSCKLIAISNNNRDVLNDYINFVNLKTNQSIVENIALRIDEKKVMLKSRLNMLEKQAIRKVKDSEELNIYPSTTVLNNSNLLGIVEPETYAINSMLDLASEFNTEMTLNINSFETQSIPEMKYVKHSKNLKIMLLVALVLGGVIGSLIILIRRLVKA